MSEDDIKKAQPPYQSMPSAEQRGNGDVFDDNEMLANDQFADDIQYESVEDESNLEAHEDTVNDLGESDLVDNPTTRAPIVICVDTSNALLPMDFARVNNGLKIFCDMALSNEILKSSLELCIITYSGDAQCAMDFSSCDKLNLPMLKVRGQNAHVVEGMSLSLDMLEDRLQRYRDNGINYYQPWIVLLAAQSCQEDDSEIEARIHQFDNEHRLHIFPVNINNKSAITLPHITDRPAANLKNFDFENLFRWLSKSLNFVSRSNANNRILLDEEFLNKWTK